MLEAGALIGLGVALGAGLLIGLERERRKSERGDAAGLRSFAVVALSGALVQSNTALLVVGAGFVAAMAALSFWRSRSAADAGMTTELALFATFLIGVQAPAQPALAAACATALALLLAARQELHQFATQWLTRRELEDGLLLAALTLIALPLIPAGPIPALAGISLRPLAVLVLLIMGMQALGQVAMRRLGTGAGLLLSALLSGFVSSTATIASLGARARTQPEQAAALARAASLSTVATWLQALAMCAAVAPAAIPALLPLALLGVCAAAAVALAGRAVEALPVVVERGSALRPRAALGVALLLAAVTWAVTLARGHFGAAAMWVGVGLSGLADAHAPVASLAALHAAGQLGVQDLRHGLLVTIAANSVTRALVAVVTGGRAFAGRVALTLICGWLAAAGYHFIPGL